jgi:hypothetical protein
MSYVSLIEEKIESVVEEKDESGSQSESAHQAKIGSISRRHHLK